MDPCHCVPVWHGWPGLDATPYLATLITLINSDQLHQQLLSQLERALQRTLPDAFLERISLSLSSATETTEAISPGAIELALINGNFDTGPLAPEVMHAVIANPAYWAFCWGSGLALARVLCQNPDWVAGLRVLDFGSGSGVAGIAAGLAGAASVVACDNDPDALLATRTNAALNQIDVELCGDLDALPDMDQPVDLILVADVLYDRANLPLLAQLEALGAPLLIADSRITDLTPWGYQRFASQGALTMPNLGEFDEFRTVHFFRAANGARP
ncbi:MAG: methyltransferase [Pseudomonadales bacterium]